MEDRVLNEMLRFASESLLIRGSLHRWTSGTTAFNVQMYMIGSFASLGPDNIFYAPMEFRSDETHCGIIGLNRAAVLKVEGFREHVSSWAVSSWKLPHRCVFCESLIDNDQGNPDIARRNVSLENLEIFVPMLVINEVMRQRSVFSLAAADVKLTNRLSKLLLEARTGVRRVTGIL